MSTTEYTQRRSIHVDGVSHGAAPIPMGARIGNVVWSSGIAGVDPSTSKLAADAASQALHAFENLRTLLANAGSRLDDVIRLTVYVTGDHARPHINAQWLKCFPDPASRPARHILVHDLQHGMHLQIEAVAVITSESE